MPVDETVLTTCPRDCYDACGIEVAKRDGAIRHARGDPGHPVSRGRLCTKCATAYNGILLDPDARPTAVALDYLYGTSEDGFDPRTAADAACILVWGANPSASAPHQPEQWLPEAPARVVVVDSVFTSTGPGAGCWTRST